MRLLRANRNSLFIYILHQVIVCVVDLVFCYTIVCNEKVQLDTWLCIERSRYKQVTASLLVCYTACLSVCLFVCLSSVDAQCRDIVSEDQQALIIGQQVCFQCPLAGSTFSWTFLDTPILPEGVEGFANGTLVINSVAQVHLDPAYFRCEADSVQSSPYRLVEACELHAHMHVPLVCAHLSLQG